jgi:group I intron endonuclease
VIRQKTELLHVIGVVGRGDMAIVYKITNKTTKKCYVGYTIHSVNTRWKQHIARSLNKNINVKFDNAIRKYGVSEWNVEILEEGLSVSESKNKERYYIQLFDAYNDGYNSTLGGDGNYGIIMSAESNQKRSNALKGKKKNYNRMHGKFHTDESKQKISKSHLGMKKPWVKWSSEQIEKRALSRRALTFEQYQQIKELKQLGLTRIQIAEKINVSFDVVKKWINRPWNVTHKTVN